MRSDFPQLDLELDFAPVKFPAHLGALGLDLLLGPGLQLLGADRRLAARHLEQLGGVLFRRAGGCAG